MPMVPYGCAIENRLRPRSILCQRKRPFAGISNQTRCRLCLGRGGRIVRPEWWPCRSCRLLVRAGAAQLAAERGEPFDPQAEVDAVGLQIDAFDQQLDDAGLLCRE
jgi:hypothetical protein